MKSWIAAFTTGVFAASAMLSGEAFAAQPTPGTPVVVMAAAPGGGSLNAKPDAGGITPCFINCYLGPRTGTEYNEGRGIATMEWLQLVPGISGIARIILGLQAYQGKTMSEFAKENAMDSRPIPAPKGNVASKGGITACLVTCYFGPRVAFERNEGRKIRSKEIWLIIPILNIVAAVLMGLEAYNGKTMTQIARDEGLDG
jgi:hypothetical protein